MKISYTFFTASLLNLVSKGAVNGFDVEKETDKRGSFIESPSSSNKSFLRSSTKETNDIGTTLSQSLQEDPNDVRFLQQCSDLDWTYSTMFMTATCAMYDYDPDEWCENFGYYTDTNGISATEACCVCGGGIIEEEETDVPSLAPSFPSWEIANATYTDHLNQETSYITLEHDIGTANSDLKVTLYEYDCETVVTSDAAVSLDDDKISGRKASYDVELARGSVGSSAFLVTEGEDENELQFCVGAGLHVPTADLPVGVEDYGSIVSKKTKIAIAFNLEDATFTVTQFETQGENPAETDITADDNFYEMEACICSTSFDCDSATGSVATQEENSVVFICLKPPTGLNFEGYNMIFSKGNGPVADSDFSYNAIGAPFTSEETEGNMIRVRTQLLSGLFDVGQQGTAQVSGTGNFVFDTNAKDGKEDEVEGNFKMFVGLQEVEECKPSLFVEILTALGMENVF